MATDDPRRVHLKRVRLSFSDALYEKEKTSDDPNAVASHHTNVIVPKDRPEFEANNAAIMAGIRAAGEQKWGDKDAFKRIAEDTPKRVCYRAGARWKNREGQVYAGYDGNFALTGKGPGKPAGSKRPKLLDRRKRRLREQATAEHINANKIFEEKEIPDIFYGGVDCDVVVSFYGTEKGSDGIFCTIEAVRSHETGERLASGGYNVDDDDFEDLEDDESFDDDGDDDLVG